MGIYSRWRVHVEWCFEHWVTLVSNCQELWIE